MNTNGSNVVNLTNNSADDRLADNPYSPDGTKIIFRSDRNGNQDVFVMNTDGSGVINITNNSADDSPVGFTPDGSKIVFISDRDENADIYTANTDGTGVSNITNNSASNMLCIIGEVVEE
jgi:Tol biopolymer transport system component